MQKRLLTIIAVLTIAMGMLACGTAQTTTLEPTATPTPELTATPTPEPTVSIPEYIDEIGVTGEQIKEAYFGDWINFVINEDSISIDYYDMSTANVFFYKSKMTYTGFEVMEGLVFEGYDFSPKPVESKTSGTKELVLIFNTENGDTVRIYKAYDCYFLFECNILVVEVIATDGTSKTAFAREKYSIKEDSYKKVDEVFEAIQNGAF